MKTLVRNLVIISSSFLDGQKKPLCWRSTYLSVRKCQKTFIICQLIQTWLTNDGISKEWLSNKAFGNSPINFPKDLFFQLQFISLVYCWSYKLQPSAFVLYKKREGPESHVLPRFLMRKTQEKSEKYSHDLCFWVHQEYNKNLGNL